MRVSIISLSLLFFLAYANTALAQSWGQFKSAAQQAESEKKFDEALGYWQKAMDLCPEKNGPRYKQSLSAYAYCLEQAGKTSEAESCYKNFSELCQAASLDDDARIALSRYAEFLRRNAKEGEAKELEKRFDLLKQSSRVKPEAEAEKTDTASASGKTGDLKAWQALINEGASEAARKHYEVAETKFRAALDLAEKLENNRRAISESLSKLITLYYAQNNFAKAEPYYAKSLNLCRSSSGAESKDYAESLRGHAAILRKLNRKQEAMAEEGQADRIMAKYEKYTSGGSETQGSRHGADPAATRSGSVLQRAGAARQGFDNPATQLLNE